MVIAGYFEPRFKPALMTLIVCYLHRLGKAYANLSILLKRLLPNEGATGIFGSSL